MRLQKTMLSLVSCALLWVLTPIKLASSQENSVSSAQTRPIRLGVSTVGVSRPMSSLQKQAVFPVAGSPDWSVVTSDALWVTSGETNHVVQLLSSTNTIGLSVSIERPCSGLAEGFGSIWAPSCGTHEVLRIDKATGKIQARIAADPANSEGGITVGAGSIWIVRKPSTLVQISPQTNEVIKTIQLPSGSENPLFHDGFLWVSSSQQSQLLKIDPASGTILAKIAVGPTPRFLTADATSIWTLNQGDGTVSRVDKSSGKLLATIECGIPGMGGEITFGNGAVWVTMFDFPLTQIDPLTNKVVKQWTGAGGDGVRFGLGSVWLSNGHLGNVWRLAPVQQ